MDVVDRLVRGQPVEELPAGIAAVPQIAQGLFRPSVRPYLASWMRLDPVDEIARLAAPSLIVQGTTDLQVTARDAEALAGAAREGRLVVIDGMNHVLKVAPEERAANLAAYADPSLPLAPGLVDAVAGFLRPAGQASAGGGPQAGARN